MPFRRKPAVATGLALAALAARTAAIASADGYPSRPAGVRTYSVVGTLVDYTLGNHDGGATVRTADGTVVDAEIAYPNLIDGRHYRCQTFPSVAAPAPDRVSCSQRPPVEIGRSRVRMTFWYARRLDRRTRISDEIDVALPEHPKR